MAAKGLPGAVPTVDAKGKLFTFGNLIGATGAFAVAHPVLAASLRDGNDRRNSIPASHPFETKGGKKTKRLQVKERNALRTKFATAYVEVMEYVNANGW